ncbi:MAG TPA: hypothetical protein VIC87_10590 [Vicinamibacteria bacterium]
MDLAEKLLVLADSAAGDGAQGLVRALRAVLSEIAPFDAGEAVLVSGERLLRWRLDDHDGELLGADVVRHIGTLHAPLRLDDLDDAKAFPETHERLVAEGMRSLLVLPFQGGGALAVARRYGWAFVGASLHHLWPVRGIAGISLRQAVLLTGLAQKVEAQAEDLERANATPDELRARLERAHAELRECSGQRSAANTGWEATRAELRETARALAAAEAAARAAREAEEGAEARAADLDRRLRDEERKRESAEAEAQRRQAQVDETIGRAEGERQSLALEADALRGEAATTQERLHTAERELESLRWSLEECDTRARLLDARRAELQAALDETAADRDEARRAGDRARAAAEDAERRAARAQEEAALAVSLREERDAARSEAEALRTRLDTDVPALEAEARVLKKELATSRDESARLLHDAPGGKVRPKVRAARTTRRRRNES